MQREAARAAAEKSLKEQQEKTKRDADTQRQREQEAQAKRAAEERTKAAEAKRRRDAELQAQSNAQAKRDAEPPADPDATEIRYAPGKKAPGVPAPIDDPDATLIRADATIIRDVDATFIQYRGDQAKPQPANDAPGRGIKSRKSGGAADIEGTPASTSVDIDLSEDASDPSSASVDPSTEQTIAYQAPAPAGVLAKSPAVPVTAKGTTPAPAAVRPAPSSGRTSVADADEPDGAPEAKNRPVQMIAGVAVVLAAVGAGWVYFMSGPTPAPASAEKAATAQSQESTPTPPPPRKDAEPKTSSDKAAPDAPKVTEAQKAAEAAEQHKLEQEAQNRAVEKAAAGKAAADKLAAGQSAADKAAAKGASDKVTADKLAAAKTMVAGSR